MLGDEVAVPHDWLVLERPVSALMEDVQNLHFVLVQPVGHDIRRPGYDQLEGVRDSAFAAKVREINKLADLLADVVINAQGGQDIALCDVVD